MQALHKRGTYINFDEHRSRPDVFSLQRHSRPSLYSSVWYVPILL